MEWFSTLSLALGSAWTSGINLYATVTVLGMLQKFGVAKLPGGLDVLDNWWIIGIAAGLYVIEFVADKVPYVESVWDVVHTFIRVPAGAAVAYSATTGDAAAVNVIATLLGGGLALSSHGTKAALRAGAFDASRVHPDHGVAYNWTAQAPLAGLYGKTVGIVGMGEVGVMAARMAQGFSARVLYCNRTRLSPEKERALGVDYRPLPALLADSDFVSLHASNLPDNKGMIDAKFFAAMKRTAYFVNTSRGRMVDEQALADALTRGVIAGAGIDVFFEEPLPLPSPLTGLTNIILTPHIAGGSRVGIIDEVAAVLGNCRAVLKGGEIKHRVA